MRKNSSSTSGNIFLAIFGAVALVGVLGAGVMTFSKGPVQGSLNIIRKNNAAVDMSMAGQMAIMTAANSSVATSSATVFVTSGTYTGNLGGLTGADTICQNLANAAGLQGTYKAWLSSWLTSAASRLTQLNVPYKLVNGTVIANNWADLTDGSIANNIDRTETGTYISSSYAWTNTTETGALFAGTSGNTCANWTNGTSANQGRRGATNFSTAIWTNQALQSCNASNYLYCFGQTASLAGDCDGDGYIEPPEWRDAGAAPKPVNGGLIPNSIGIAKKDPWGNDYGYCVWDHGATSLTPVCQSATGTDRRLQGSDTKKYPVVAIISAGPDGVFTTTCRNFSTGTDKADQDGDGNLEGTGDFPLVSKAAATDDDIIVTYNYSDAMATSGGLWKLKSTDLNTAYLNKKIEALGASIYGTASFDRIGAMTGDFIDMITGIKFADPTVVTTCNATNTNVIRRMASGYGYETCNGSSWISPTGGIPTSIGGFSDGKTVGTNNFIAGLNAGNGAISGSNNTGLGISVMSLATTGFSNSAMGFEALSSLTTGDSNTALGWRAGKNITTGSGNNTAIGYEALMSCQTCQYSTVVGYQAAKLTGNYSYNTVIGSMALLSNVTGFSNTIFGTEAAKSGEPVKLNDLIGYQAGLYAGSMSQNVGIGSKVMQLNTGSMNNNVALGSGAMKGAAASSAANANTAIGSGALAQLSSGSDNVAIGIGAANLNVGNSNCVAIGPTANRNCTTGTVGIGYQALTTATGAENTAVGYQSGLGITTGASNTAFGYLSMNGITTGSYNTAIGSQTMTATATSTRSTAVGYQNLNKGGNDNTVIGFQNAAWGGVAVTGTTAFGYGIMPGLTTGTGNTGVGFFSMYPLTTGSNNTAFGSQAGKAIAAGAVNNTYVGGLTSFVTASGNNNTGIGYLTMFQGVGDYNVGIGSLYQGSASSGSKNICVGGCQAPGSDNVGIGTSAVLQASVNQNVGVGYQALMNATSDGNTAIGSTASQGLTSGSKNTAFGYKTLLSNQTGTENTAIGAAPMNFTTGSSNTAVGGSALGNQSSGSTSTAMGYNTMYSITNGGNSNTAFGGGALYLLTSGSLNSVMGYNVLYTPSTLSNITAIGDAASISSGLSNSAAIGAGATVTASNTIRFGNTSVTLISGQVAFTATSDMRVKKDIHPTDLGLDFIMKLKPVSYRLIDGNGRLDYGFIAQDVEEALEGRKTNLITRENNTMKTYRMRPDDLLSPIVRAVQEQQNELKALESQLEKVN